MIGIIKPGRCERGAVQDEVVNVKLPCRPAHLILVHVFQKVDHFLIRILHRCPLAAIGCIVYGVRQQRPLSQIEGIVAFEVAK